MKGSGVRVSPSAPSLVEPNDESPFRGAQIRAGGSRVSRDERGRTHARWLKAAAAYNVAWGAANVFWPRRALRALGVSDPGPTFAWQTVGMMVGSYAPAYWWASRDPVSRG